MRWTARAFLVAALVLTACGAQAGPARAPTASSTVEPSPTAVLVAIASTTAARSSQPVVTPPATVAPFPTSLATPTQTRVPNSDALPTPHGLPATDGCLYYGAQPPYITFVDCVVHGLPPAAPVRLTANGEVVFLRIGSTIVFPDGTWYFPWSENQHKEIVFVVTAGGVSRTLTQVFK